MFINLTLAYNTYVNDECKVINKTVSVNVNHIQYYLDGYVKMRDHVDLKIVETAEEISNKINIAQTYRDMRKI